MNRSVIFTLVGLLLGVAGIIIGYFFLKSLDQVPNIVFLFLTFAMFTGSIICLYVVTNPRKPKVNPIVDPSEVDLRTAEMLSKNSSVLTTWNKTIDTQDKLKLIKMVAAEEDENSPK